MPRYNVQPGDLLLEKLFRFALRGRDVHLNLEHLRQVVAAFGLVDPVLLVLPAHHGVEHLPVQPDHEQQARDVQIQLQRFQNLKCDARQTTVQIVDQHCQAARRPALLVLREELHHPCPKRFLELIEESLLRSAHFAQLVEDGLEQLAADFRFDAGLLVADSRLNLDARQRR